MSRFLRTWVENQEKVSEINGCHLRLDCHFTPLVKVFFSFLSNNYFFCLTNTKTQLLNYFDPVKVKKIRFCIHQQLDAETC